MSDKEKNIYHLQTSPMATGPSFRTEKNVPLQIALSLKVKFMSLLRVCYSLSLPYFPNSSNHVQICPPVHPSLHPPPLSTLTGPAIHLYIHCLPIHPLHPSLCPSSISHLAVCSSVPPTNICSGTALMLWGCLGHGPLLLRQASPAEASSNSPHCDFLPFALFDPLFRLLWH